MQLFGRVSVVAVVAVVVVGFIIIITEVWWVCCACGRFLAGVILSACVCLSVSSIEWWWYWWCFPQMKKSKAEMKNTLRPFYLFR